MTIKKTDTIEKIEAKIKQLEARKRAELAKRNQAEKKRKLSILWSWGECVEKLLISEELNSERFKENLKKYLPEGTKRENAINAIDDILASQRTSHTQENITETPTENNPIQTMEDRSSNPY